MDQSKYSFTVLEYTFSCNLCESFSVINFIAFELFQLLQNECHFLVSACF